MWFDIMLTKTVVKKAKIKKQNEYCVVLSRKAKE